MSAEKPSGSRQEKREGGAGWGTVQVQRLAFFISHSISSHSLVLPWVPCRTAVSGLQLLFPLTWRERYERPGPPSSLPPFRSIRRRRLL